MEEHLDIKLQLTQHFYFVYFVLFKLTRPYSPLAKIKRKNNKRGTSGKHDSYTVDLRTLIPITLKKKLSAYKT